MPHLMIRNIKKDDFTAKVKDLSKKLTEVIGCPEDWITISYVENTLTYVAGEDKTNENVFIEIKWFERTKEMQDAVAKICDDTFKEEGRDIMINFVILTKDRYYEDGINC